MKGTYLGEFEELVLLAAGILTDDAYGVAIRKEIEKQTKRPVNIGAVHTALHRLEEKGYLKSEFGEATLVRGGKRKRIFTLTPFGLKVLKKAQALRSNMWSKLILQRN
ncbi:MAG TPA: helix-turn-helix transcriptional regulator [Chryseolinea sp.]|nr:helix-turn-helix transcriptional regulator [Chryseolinea sp.]